MPDESILAALAVDSVKVEKLVREFLTAQSLKILPQAPFGDAVTQFVDKDDKHAMEMFVNESLAGQVKQMLELDGDDEDELESAMERYRNRVDEMFAAGTLKRTKKAKYKPRPENWDSDMDGEWEDQPGAIELSDIGEDETPAPPARRGRSGILSDDDDDVSIAPAPTKKAPAKRAPAKKAAAPKAPAKKPAARAPARGRKKVAEPSDDEDDDIIMLEDDPQPSAPTRSQPSRAKAATRGSRQTTLNFSQSQTKAQVAKDLSEDEISDDDAFEPMAPTTRRR